MAFVNSRSRRSVCAPPAEDGESQYHSRAVAKALEILEVLGGADKPLALNQLTHKVGLSKPSVFRLLYTLEETGYVVKDQEGHYSLKHDIRPSVREKLHGALLKIASPVLRELTREFRETTGLAVLFDNHIEVIAVVESPQTVRMGNTVGRILQPHASSLGKCITAFQPEQRREHLLRSYGVNRITKNTIVDENALADEFRRIREVGSALDRGETCLEGQCFGAPIRNPEGEVFAAISISVPVSRLGTPTHQARILERIVAAAARISKSVSL
jgi:IclR family acetate operon transcriptional repressor